MPPLLVGSRQHEELPFCLLPTSYRGVLYVLYFWHDVYLRVFLSACALGRAFLAPKAPLLPLLPFVCPMNTTTKIFFFTLDYIQPLLFLLLPTFCHQRQACLNTAIRYSRSCHFHCRCYSPTVYDCPPLSVRQKKEEGSFWALNAISWKREEEEEEEEEEG